MEGSRWKPGSLTRVPSRSRKAAAGQRGSGEAAGQRGVILALRLATAAATWRKQSSGSVRGSRTTAAVLHAGHDRRVAEPEGERQGIGAARAGVEHHERRRQVGGREGATASHRRTVGEAGRRGSGAGGSDCVGELLRRRRQLVRRHRQHGQDRDLTEGELRIPIELERRLECGEGHLVGARRAGEWIGAAARQQRPPARPGTPPVVRRGACRRRR